MLPFIRHAVVTLHIPTGADTIKPPDNKQLIVHHLQFSQLNNYIMDSMSQWEASKTEFPLDVFVSPQCRSCCVGLS